MRIVLQGSLIVALATLVRVPSARMRASATELPAVQVSLAHDVTGSGHSEASAAESPRTEAVVVVVLDGARWQEVLVATDANFARGDDRGVAATTIMPTLHAMIQDGAVVGAPDHGPPMVATGPHFISLPGYNEIFSGKSPRACFDNECPETRTPTLVDELRARSSDVAVFSSWGPIARAASLPSADIVRSTGGAGTGEFRADRATADEALAYYSERRPTFMFLGLGEPDEYAHRGDYAGYIDSLRQADTILGELRDVLGQMGERGRHTSVIVTCDHGRSDDFRDHGGPWPESARVWMVASGGAIPRLGYVDSIRKHRLADIAPTVRVLLGLPADEAGESLGVGAPIDELVSPRLLPSPR